MKLEFDPIFYELIKKELKTTTWRKLKKTTIVNPEFINADFQNGKTLKLKITNIYFKQFNELDNNDALKDGFENTSELRHALREYYPCTTGRDLLICYEFNLKKSFLDKLKEKIMEIYIYSIAYK